LRCSRCRQLISPDSTDCDLALEVVELGVVVERLQMFYVHAECARDAIDSGRRFLQQRFANRQVTIHPLVARRTASKN
jgi:hypothetical protein